MVALLNAPAERFWSGDADGAELLIGDELAFTGGSTNEGLESSAGRLVGLLFEVDAHCREGDFQDASVSSLFDDDQVRARGFTFVGPVAESLFNVLADSAIARRGRPGNGQFSVVHLSCVSGIEFGTLETLIHERRAWPCLTKEAHPDRRLPSGQGRFREVVWEIDLGEISGGVLEYLVQTSCLSGRSLVGIRRWPVRLRAYVSGRRPT